MRKGDPPYQGVVLFVAVAISAVLHLLGIDEPWLDLMAFPIALVWVVCALAQARRDARAAKSMGGEAQGPSAGSGGAAGNV